MLLLFLVLNAIVATTFTTTTTTTTTTTAAAAATTAATTTTTTYHHNYHSNHHHHNYHFNHHHHQFKTLFDSLSSLVVVSPLLSREAVVHCVSWLVGFLTSSSTTRLYRGRAPRQERLTILRAATHETELGDHGFCFSRSHYTDTDPTSRERAATAGIEPGSSSPGVARSTAELPRPRSCYI